jgi:hypothetical protein
MTAGIAVEKPQSSATEQVIMVEDVNVTEAKSLDIADVVGDLPVPHVSMPIEVQVDNEKVQLQRFEDSWNHRLDQEFDTLADRAVRGELDSFAKARFDYLMDLRRSLHHPRAVQEIIHEQERTEVLNSLTRALSRYVTFIGNGRTHQAGNTSKKKTTGA